MQEIRIPRGGVPAPLWQVMNALCDVAVGLSEAVGQGPLAGQLAANIGHNTDGDQQKALDVLADDAFAHAVQGTGVRWYASEERETVNEIDVNGALALAIDPLDGSSNINCNVSIGTIFSIQPALDDGTETFLRDGSHLLASGYFIYGPHTALVVTFGAGVRQYILDRSTGAFVETETTMIPPEASEFAINASNYRHWAKPVRAYIDDCLAGSEGPRGKNFNMRWVASLVAETHRIMCRGGIFLYPGDERKGYENGRLRLVYECAPIAFLVEQAGGKATTGTARILSQIPTSLHARTPMVFGTADKVDRVSTYHDLPETEVSALFGNRGLFRA